MNKMIKPTWQTQIIWLLKVNPVVWVINGILLAILVLSGSNVLSIVSSGYFSKITFLETGVALMIGGILAFMGSASATKNKELVTKTQETWSINTLKVGEKRANKYLLLSIILFIQSIIISVLGY